MPSLPPTYYMNNNGYIDIVAEGKRYGWVHRRDNGQLSGHSTQTFAHIEEAAAVAAKIAEARGVPLGVRAERVIHDYLDELGETLEPYRGQR